MLGLGLVRILGLFGLMFDLFWNHFWFPRSESIFGNLMLLGFHVRSSGAPFWKPGDSKGSILKVLGSFRAPLLMIFEGPKAPGHARGASLCSKGGLDRFWKRFWEPNANPKGANLHPKIHVKKNKI